MNIQDALKETGKAYMVNFDSSYVAISDANYLNWYDRKDNRELDGVEFEYIMCDNWQPYHEVKEIKPEKAGELWAFDGRECFIVTKHREIYRAWKNGHDTDIVGDEYRAYLSSTKGMIHGKNMWIRLFPPVLTEEEMKADIRRMLSTSDIERVEMVHSGYRNGDEICLRFRDLDPLVEDMIKSRIEQNEDIILEVPKD